MSHSWGLTVPPKLVHRKPQAFSLGSLRLSNQHAKGHALHTHADTPVRRGQGSGEKYRADGRREGGACHSSAIHCLSIKPGKL